MAELTIAVVGLLIAFKGAVDSFVLIDAITEADNGQHYLALKYFIEKQKLCLWSDACKLDDPDNSTLRHESVQTRKLIAAALAEIQAVNIAAKKYLKRYAMKETETPKADDGSTMSLATVNAALVDAMASDRVLHRPVQRFLWATKDKDKFTELIGRLQTLVGDLKELANSSRGKVVDEGLCVYVVPAITDSNQLQALRGSDTDAGSLISLAALLKQLQMFPVHADNVPKIPMQALGLNPNSLTSLQRDFRSVCDLSEDGKLDRRVWIEWKSISATLSESDVQALEARVAELARLLCAPKPAQYRVPRCIGLTEIHRSNQVLTANLTTFEATTQPKHFGFIYEYPSTQCDDLKQPVTLLELLKTSRQMPLLNDRLSLARGIVSTLSLLHASRWLHKGFRSSRVLFFHPSKGSLTISQPYITGFELSRPEVSAGSIETALSGDPAIDLYHHPDSTKGFSRLRDYYSLGVVLFEIALWRSFEVRIPKDTGKELKDLSLNDIHKGLIESIPALGGVVGSTYQDVVERCLKGSFGQQDDKDGAYLGRAFFRHVVQELDRCRV